jgi:predicted transcriptional regulator of viral defense system
MKNQTNIEKLVTSGKHVFTTDDLAVLWVINDRRKLIERIKYYLRNGRLTHVYKGLYAYGDFSALEVAQKLVPFSYVSLYTAAQIHGLTFQYYSTVFCVSLKSKKYNFNGQSYEYHKVREPTFYNVLGLIQEDGYLIAGKERTICDLLYVYPHSAFDNLKNIDTPLLQQISLIYGNKRLERDVTRLITTLESED